MKLDVIAIDGPAAAGKSTVAQKVAGRLGVHYINTGNMYRAVAFSALKNGFCEPLDNQKIAGMLSDFDVGYEMDNDGKLFLTVKGKPADPGIRSPETARHVSAIAALPEVREWLIGRQRSFVKLGMIVMEGRDIGTVVFPDAKYKFYLTASPEVRARRRLEQDGETADGATIASVAKEIAARDEMDTMRAVAPLRKAEDAFLVDSSEMTREEVVAKIISRIRELSGKDSTNE